MNLLLTSVSAGWLSFLRLVKTPPDAAPRSHSAVPCTHVQPTVGSANHSKPHQSSRIVCFLSDVVIYSFITFEPWKSARIDRNSGRVSTREKRVKTIALTVQRLIFH